jgi:hypothetical protein
MQSLTLQLKFVAFLMILALSAKAQESAVSSGGTASGSTGKVTYSIGLTNWQTFSSNTGSVAAGVQHPYDIKVISGIGVTGITLEMSLYPNPTPDMLNLRIKSPMTETLSMILYDLNGSVLEQKQITQSDTQLFLGKVVAGTYFLKVYTTQNEIKTFKIIKL